MNLPRDQVRYQVINLRFCSSLPSLDTFLTTRTIIFLPDHGNKNQEEKKKKPGRGVWGGERDFGERKAQILGQSKKSKSKSENMLVFGSY